MLMIKAFHIIAMVAWFAGLFYLPRLFVYHAQTTDAVSLDRFCVMERRLYYAIMWPAAVLTSLFGVWLLVDSWSYYRSAGWMHMKLLLVVVLWSYHLMCGHYVKCFAQKCNARATRYFRFFNEIPTLLLLSIVLLVVLKP